MHLASALRNEMDYKQIKAIEKKNKEKLKKHNRFLNEHSGIYFLTRTDEAGIRHAYVGQAKHILTRLAQHLSGYQYIDLSLRKRGLWSEENPYGWNTSFAEYPEDRLDDMEKRFIRLYADKGYQLYNLTAGGQGKGKVQIGEYKPSRGYRDGLRQGKLALVRDLNNIIDKHLTIEIKEAKKGNKTSQKALEKFKSLLSEESYEQEANTER